MNSGRRPHPNLHEGHKHIFDTLCRACGKQDLALVSAIRKSDGAPVALVCAVNHFDDGRYALVPLAVMVEGNPYEDYLPPPLTEEDEGCDEPVGNNRCKGFEPRIESHRQLTLFDDQPTRIDWHPRLFDNLN